MAKKEKKGTDAPEQRLDPIVIGGRGYAFVTETSLEMVMRETVEKLRDEQVDTPVEFQKIFKEKFWDLLA